MKRRSFLGMCVALLGAAVVRGLPAVGLPLASDDYEYCERGIREGIHYQTVGNRDHAVTVWVKPDGTRGVLQGTIDALV